LIPAKEFHLTKRTACSSASLSLSISTVSDPRLLREVGDLMFLFYL